MLKGPFNPYCLLQLPARYRRCTGALVAVETFDTATWPPAILTLLPVRRAPRCCAPFAGALYLARLWNSDAGLWYLPKNT